MYLVCFLFFETGSLITEAVLELLCSQGGAQLLIFLLLPLPQALGRWPTQMNLKLILGACGVVRLKFLGVCDLFACSCVIFLSL